MNENIRVRVHRSVLNRTDGHGRIIRITVRAVRIAAWMLRIIAASLDAAARWSEGR
jgi:hypothetical protein